MLHDDKHNAARLDFLAHFAQWITSLQHPDLRGALVKDAMPWVASRTQKVLKKLRKPETSECKALLSAASSHGGIAFLEDR